jgi:oligopeptide transport system permease protein
VAKGDSVSRGVGKGLLQRVIFGRGPKSLSSLFVRSAKNLILINALLIAALYSLFQFLPNNYEFGSTGVISSDGVSYSVWQLFSQILDFSLAPGWWSRDKSYIGYILDKAVVSGLMGLVAYLLVLFFSSILVYVSLVGTGMRKLVDRVADAVLSLPGLAVAAISVYLFVILIPVASLNAGNSLGSYVLPVLLIAFRSVFFLYRQSFQVIHESASHDSIRTAVAKGLDVKRITFRHVIRLSLPAIIGIQPILLVNFLTGTFIVESIFSIPGLGVFFVDAIRGLEFEAIIWSCLIFSVLLHLAQELANVIRGTFDPRGIRHEV